MIQLASTNNTYFVMFFKDFPETCKIEGLVILQQDQAQIEFTESQLQLLYLSSRNAGYLNWFLSQWWSTTGLVTQWNSQFILQCSKFTCCFCHFFWDEKKNLCLNTECKIYTLKSTNNKLHKDPHSSEFWFKVISSEVTHQNTQDNISPHA